MQTRKGKIRKSSLKLALWSFAHLNNKSHTASAPLRSSAPAGLLGEPQVNPKTLQGHICAEGWVKTFHSADERQFGCSQLCAGAFSQLQFVTIKWQWKHISQYHMKFGTQRAAVTAKSFSDNSHATSESQFCLFSGLAGATFLHNGDLIFCRTFPPCVLSQAKEEGDNNPSLTRNFI